VQVPAIRDTLGSMQSLVSELEARLQTLGDTPEDPRERIDALVELAWEIRFTDSVRANDLALEARELCIAIGYPAGQARAARVLSMTRGDTPKQLSEYVAFGEEARDLADEVGDRVLQAGTRDFLASIYEHLGEYSTAMEFAQEALAIAREIDDPVRQAFALCNVSGILAALGDVSTGIERGREALRLFTIAEHDQGIGRICSLLSKLYRESGDLDQALEHARRVHEEAERSGLPDSRAEALSTMGEVELDLGHRDTAERLFRESLAAFDSDEGRALMGRAIRVNLARLLMERGEFEEAETELDAASADLGIFGESSPADEVRIRQALADLNEKRGDHGQANRELREVLRLREQVAQKEMRERLAQLEARADVKAARQEAEIHRLKFVELSRMQAQLVEAEKMAQLGTLAGGTAHELNSPLGVLRSNLDSYARATQKLAHLASGSDSRPAEVARLDAALAACRRTSEEAITRIAALVDSFKRFTQLDLAEKRTFSVIEGLNAALALLGPNLPAGVEVKRSFEPVPNIEGWPGQLNQAFMTVLMNAVEAIDGEGVVAVETTTENGELRIRIRDSGRGMTTEECERLFEVGWSAAGQRTKMRLGLSAARATIHRHGGRIEVESAPGKGSTFSFVIPVRE
jgi:two-component system NtrC family sensor kinase